MKNLAIKINDFLVAVGLFLIVVVTALAMLGGGGFAALGFGVLALLVWAIGAGLWCVLSGIYDELKKMNKNA